MGLTTDPNSACLRKIKENGQQECYLVLSEEERKKGFIRPLRYSYIHLACGTRTDMGQAIAETYARQPSFYGGTFCCACGKHFYLKEIVDGKERHNFEWIPDRSPVGS